MRAAGATAANAAASCTPSCALAVLHVAAGCSTAASARAERTLTTADGFATVSAVRTVGALAFAAAVLGDVVVDARPCLSADGAETPATTSSAAYAASDEGAAGTRDATTAWSAASAGA